MEALRRRPPCKQTEQLLKSINNSYLLCVHYRTLIYICQLDFVKFNHIFSNRIHAKKLLSTKYIMKTYQSTTAPM